MRLQYLDGFKAKAEASKSIHTRERSTNETGASSQKDAIGSLVSSRMSDGSDVEYGKKEFVIFETPRCRDVSEFSISANSFTHNMRTKNKLYLMVSGRTRRFLVLLASQSNLKWLYMSACDQGWDVQGRISGVLSVVLMVTQV
jgi:hypothetical protein